MKLILASGSPRRRKLLKKLKIPFKVIVSHVSEVSRETRPERLVRELALRKAQAVERRLRQASFEPNVVRSKRRLNQTSFILGADTVVVLDGKILGKPKDARDAYRILYRLSGSRHRVYTGVALVCGRTVLVDHAVSTVQMKKIGLDQLLILSRKHLDKAGAYAIQEKKDPIARIVRGSYDNVVGLPVDLVRKMIKRFLRRRPGGS